MKNEEVRMKNGRRFAWMKTFLPFLLVVASARAGAANNETITRRGKNVFIKAHPETFFILTSSFFILISSPP